MAVRPMEGLYYGVGRWNAGWYALMAMLLVFVAVGVFAYSVQLTQGEVVTGLRDIGTMGGAAWGLYVAFVVYFVGVSFAGMTIAALIRLFDLEDLRPVSRMAELLTIIALILGALSVLADVGQPLRALINLPRYGRPMSPFFGTFTLVLSGYLFASLVYLYLDGRRDAAICAERTQGALKRFYRFWAAGYGDTPAERQRHERATFWLALAILPLLVVAHSTLGVVFGLQIGRPGWYSALQAPGFVILAGVSGIGHLIVIAAIFRRLLGERERLNLKLFQWLGNILLVLTITYLYFMLIEWLTSTYAANYHEARISRAILTGEYAAIFWLSVASLVVPLVLLFLQFVTGRYSVGLIVLSGAVVNLAAIGKRYLIVVPSQTHGTLLPYGVGSYSPTWVEASVILGLLGLGALCYTIFMKVFPIMGIPETARGGR
ncbi:MAG: NrfD/PsrC family molybdoenzyme membrane anchor subunit [Candidatus Methylomirabilia bacterium]